MYGKGLRALSISTVAVTAIALGLVFFYAPLDAEQGFLQKIFYVHVPLAIVALCGFVAGGLMAIQHLRTRDPRWDVRSYVAIHMSLIFGVGTLITGSIWAKGSWGHWWVWDEPTLVSFLIVFLLMVVTTGVLALFGYLKVRRIRGPQQTIESVKEAREAFTPGHDKDKALTSPNGKTSRDVTADPSGW